ncbi:Long-chain-fatty-acid--CoA ligase [Patulibacter medicamentivorans]|uniref:Acyl-CoA synthetase n=1 Tax=Patulibacter medicamentivorans TaxID=1097667 RepID=H0E8S9_9ACTN|nr:AMP-dependent synthetase/ligase [Patulibacter medicamentivorans]EHN09957.1 Long-chain-fatty-acid--CoA ligase [Patulibacter medicamentivorans]
MTTTIAGTTIADLAFRAAEAYGDRTAARYQTAPGEWSELSYADLADAATEIGLGLIDLGLDPGDRVAVLGSTRPLWSMAHLGIVATGAVHVSVYPTNAPEECAWVVGNSESRGIVCEDAAQVAKIQQVRDQLPALEWIVVLDGEADGAIPLAEVRRRGSEREPSELRERAAAVTADDPYVFMYTSGTTGPPKGCVLSHGNYRWIMGASDELAGMEDDGVLYLFLPLAHAFALLFQLLCFDHGGVIAYWGGDPTKIVPELMTVKPTHLPSVPRIFEKIYTLAVGSKPAEEQAQIIAAAQLGVRVRDLQQRGEPVPAELQAKFDEADAALFQNVRALFGGQLSRAITGAAPIAKEILEFFYGCGVPVMEGYGMTETSTGATINTPEHHRFGTVGRPLPGLEARIAEDGELLLKGGNIFQGYYKMEDASFGAITDGWLHTGDLGAIDEDGYVSIVGRKKDIIITAGGKNLTPANLENDLKTSPWISQAVMHGDRRPYPVVLITLDPETILPWAEQQGLPTTIAELAKHPRVHALIQEAVDHANAKLARVEQVKKFVIPDRDLSQETGELTPTLKVKRNVVNDHFAADFDALYAAD